MAPPRYEQPPLDPDYAALKQQAEADKTKAIQGNVSDLSAKLLQRFGASVALSGSGTASPLAVGPLTTGSPVSLANLAKAGLG